MKIYGDIARFHLQSEVILIFAHRNEKMKFKTLPIILAVGILFSFSNACKTKQPKPAEEVVEEPAEADSTFMKALLEALGNSKADTTAQPNRLLNRYNPSATRINDLLHTKLEVSFDIPNQQLIGKATLDFKPYYYNVDSLVLDAKSFDVLRVALVEKTGAMKDLSHKYVNDQIRIALDKTYTRSEQYKIFIQYTANPSRIKAGGSAAITDAKGLYFIDPKDEDPSKPTQIWTQGETESSSCWFPTIDKPNEKMTQEISITVPEKFITLSNGLKTSSKKNADGTRTDIWKMDLPHAPYLAMMAIGEYAVVKDKWKNLDVEYYVEKEFEPYARKIFGNTPEMMTFFSNKLGVEFPWPKYSQIVVRDYVSGAMENTSATIFGEFVQQTPAQMLDGNYEDVIAHELFHHWFGDLVTCESWANLPLNESFATYSEYLWQEYKYGREAADHHLQEGKNQYIEEAFGKKVNLIRFDYENREDMFDRHSYQKGGSILHMLRKYVGDEAFFDALKLYLNNNKYQPAEIHDLRLAFEKITGEDLNWFFNQWFLDRGHPTVETSWTYDEVNKNIIITLNQVQSLSSNSAFKLPMDVDIYNRGNAKRVRISMDSISQTITLPAAEKPDFVNIDAERMILGFVRQLNTREEAEWLFLNGKLYEDRFSALEKLMEYASEPGISALLKTALRDKYWSIRQYALNNLEMFLTQEDSDEFKPIITDLALSDKDARVRATATEILSKFASEVSVRESLTKALNDSSLSVQSSALSGLYQSDPENTVKVIEKMEATATGDLMTSIAAIYAASGTPNKFDYMEKAYQKATNPNDKYVLIQLIGRYAISQDEALVAKSTPIITEIARKSKAWYLRFSGIQVLVEYANYYQAQVDEVTAEISAMIEKGASVSAVQEKEILKTIVKKKISDIEATLDTIREEETDPNLSRMLNQREP